MKKIICKKCQELINGKTNQRHSGLHRSGLAVSVNYHGNNDDEYYYVCDSCGFRFIGDSCGTWPDKNDW